MGNSVPSVERVTVKPLILQINQHLRSIIIKKEINGD